MVSNVFHSSLRAGRDRICFAIKMRDGDFSPPVGRTSKEANGQTK